MEKCIYKMKLHECFTIDKNIVITRVAGGWIYEYHNQNENIPSLVFVPFNNEFQQSNPL